MKHSKLNLCLLSAASLAITLPLAGQTTGIVHDWQFNDAAGTAVFEGVADDGLLPKTNDTDWLGTTTDGDGNWHITGASENKYYGYAIDASDEMIPADKFVLTWSFSSWDWTQHTGSSPHVGFGFVGESGNRVEPGMVFRYSLSTES